MAETAVPAVWPAMLNHLDRLARDWVQAKRWHNPVMEALIVDCRLRMWIYNDYLAWSLLMPRFMPIEPLEGPLCYRSQVDELANAEPEE